MSGRGFPPSVPPPEGNQPPRAAGQQAVPPPVPPAARPAVVPPRAAAPPPGRVPVSRPVHQVPGQPPPEEDEELDVIQQFLTASPPWMLSLVLHLVVMILLGIWILSPPQRPVLVMDFYHDQLGDEDADDLVDLNLDQPVDESVLTPESPVEVDDPFAAPPQLESALNALPGATSDIQAPQIGMALLGRSEGMKRVLLRRYGGNRLSEEAVRRGLRWLARQQQRDGSWSLRGPYKNGTYQENRAAATAMALLAFQGSGHTHRRGIYRENVARGLKWLLARQRDDGSFPVESTSHTFYTQGQCTIVLCELYGMTKDPKLLAPAEKAVRYCIKHQAPLGGWRYQPSVDSDTSVTGWVLMGLQSARMAGLSVPPEVFRKAESFLNRVSNDALDRYSYQPDEEPTRVMTAEALLCRQYLGWPRNHKGLVQGVEYLLEPQNLPQWTDSERNVYYWYYATQVMHHMEGDYWKKWNSVMRDLLVKHQVKEGPEAGSWDPISDHWGAQGGRLYVTCLSIYILEVYYRHLPLYSKVRL